MKHIFHDIHMQRPSCKNLALETHQQFWSKTRIRTVSIKQNGNVPLNNCKKLPLFHCFLLTNEMVKVADLDAGLDTLPGVLCKLAVRKESKNKTQSSI